MRTITLRDIPNTHIANWIGFLLGAITMLVQFFFIDLPNRTELGEHFGQLIVFFFGYLTNLSNIWVVLIYASFIFAAAWLKIFRDGRLIVAAIAIMGTVTLVYHFILLPDLGPPEGVERFTDPIKHYLVTLALIIWWIRHVPHSTVSFRDLPFMTIPAFVYLIYVFIRGAIINAYPYSVIDVTALGYGPALIYAAGVIIGFLILCIVFIGLDKALGKLQNSGT